MTDDSTSLLEVSQLQQQTASHFGVRQGGKRAVPLKDCNYAQIVAQSFPCTQNKHCAHEHDLNTP